MKKVISAVLVLSMILSLCSCTIGGSDTKLTMGILDEITTLDPLSAKGDGEKIIASNCIEGLLRFDAEGNIDLAGATGYTADKNGLSKDYRLCHVETIEDIELMNQRALMYEYMCNKTFVASATRKELDELVIVLARNREKLEEIWKSVRQDI